MGTIADKDCLVIFSANKCWVLNVKQPSKVLAMGTKNISNGLYQMQMELQQLTTLMMETNSTIIATTKLWHRRLGHLHYQGLQVLSNLEHLQGMPLISTTSNICKHYMLGKQHKEWILKAIQHKASGINEVSHVNLCGPFP